MDEETRFRLAVGFVLSHEGGLSEDPDDPGGVTNYGISARSYPDLGPEGIRQLTREQAIAIYRRDWWDRYGYARLPDPVAAKVFDLAVNMGPAAAHRILQQALNACGQRVVVDGAIGPQTVEAARRAPAGWLMAELRLAAIRRYLSMIDADRRLVKFLRGWVQRAVA